jgi:protoporphyrinogen IX oxidase
MSFLATERILMLYLYLKSFHVIAMVAWMAGLFYLPRLYVYHAEAKAGSDTAATFKIMERKLLRFIMNPAMMLTFVFGIAMIVTDPSVMKQGWIHAKLGLVLLMAGFHGFLAATRKKFETERNTRSAKFYRLINEVPTILLIAIVVLAVVKPF